MKFLILPAVVSQLFDPLISASTCKMVEHLCVVSSLCSVYELCNNPPNVFIWLWYVLLGVSDDEWTPPLLVTSNDFDNALEILKPSVSASELENYRKLHETISRR